MMREPNINKLKLIEMMVATPQMTVRKKNALLAFHKFVQSDPCLLDIVDTVINDFTGFERELLSIELLSLLSCYEAKDIEHPDENVSRFYTVYAPMCLDFYNALPKLLRLKKKYPIDTKVEITAMSTTMASYVNTNSIPVPVIGKIYCYGHSHKIGEWSLHVKLNERSSSIRIPTEDTETKLKILK